MKRYLTFLYTWFFLISHSLSADGIPFDCSVTTEFPVIATERCQEFIVDRSPASSGPETIKATACSIETVDPEDKTIFIYTNSPNWPVWLCRDKKEWEGLQQPETPTLTVTIVDKQTGDPDDEIPAVSGGSYGDDFFDDRRPRKPGMPGITPFLLGTASAGWLPAGLMSFAFGLELPELSENSPVLFQEGAMSDDSGILVIISGSQQRVYRKMYQLGNWHLVSQTNSKASPPTEEQFDDFIAEDKLVRALVWVFGWAGKDSIPIYQMPIGKIGASGGASCGSKFTSGSETSSSRHSAGGTGSLQRKHQGQGFGSGGERNPSLSEEKSMEEKVTEADIILGAIRLIEKRLSEDWFYLGVALEVPLTSLRAVLDVRSSQRVNKMLTLAKVHQVLNFEHFLFSVRMLGNYAFFEEFLQYLLDQHFIEIKTHQRLGNLWSAPLPYVYEDRAFTGLAILDYAKSYAHNIYIYDVDAKRESGDFPKNKRTNGLILYLLRLRENGELSQASLSENAPHRAARDKIEAYFDSRAYRKVSDRPVHIFETEEKPLPMSRPTTEADILLSDCYSQMIKKSHWGDCDIQNLLLGLGLPVQALAELKSVRSSRWLSYVLETASEQGRLGFDNIVLALRAAGHNRLSSSLIEQLSLEKHIDGGKAAYLRSLTPDQQPWIVNGQLTNYFLLAVGEKLGGETSTFFLYALNDFKIRDVHEGWVRLSQNGQLSVSTGLELIKKGVEAISHMAFYQEIEERTAREIAHIQTAKLATMQVTGSTKDTATEAMEEGNECPVCFENVFSGQNYKICQTCSYAVCENCGTRIYDCPTCRGKLQKQKTPRQVRQ